MMGCGGLREVQRIPKRCGLKATFDEFWFSSETQAAPQLTCSQVVRTSSATPEYFQSLRDTNMLYLYFAEVTETIMATNETITPALTRPRSDKIHLFSFFLVFAKLAAKARLTIVALAVVGATGAHAHFGDEHDVWSFGFDE
jgi:hypothetical protein